MKSHWNVVLDQREDGTKVWTAKCLKCDAVLVGEHAHPVPIIKVIGPPDHPPMSPIAMDSLRRQAVKSWEDARKTGNPIVVPDHRIEILTIPDHGLQRALDAHSEACSKR